MTAITIRDDAHWHELRAKTVGGSEVGALFGLSPFLTEWELFMDKAGKLPRQDLERVRHITAGKFFEAGVMGWAAHKWGMKVRKVRRYLISDRCPGMGATLDFEEEGIGRRRPVEIKFPQNSDGWDWEGDTITLAPDIYLLQVQQEIECSGASDGVLVAYLGGDVRRVIYQRRDGIINTLADRISTFWKDIAAGNEPAIDFKADAEAVMRYAASMPVRSLEWAPEIEAIAKRAFENAALAKEHAETADAAKAELAHLMLEAAKKDGANDEDGKVVCEGGGYRVTNYSVSETYGTPLNAESILEYCPGARRGFRVCKVSMPKPKKGKK